MTEITKASDMRHGVRYVVTRASKHLEFQVGDRVYMDPDGSIVNSAAAGWMPPEDVAAATEGWAIAPDADWVAAMLADLDRRMAGLGTLQLSRAVRRRLEFLVRACVTEARGQ